MCIVAVEEREWSDDAMAIGSHGGRAGGSIMHCCSLFVAGNGKWGEFEEGSLLH